MLRYLVMKAETDNVKPNPPGILCLDMPESAKTRALPEQQTSDRVSGMSRELIRYKEILCFLFRKNTFFGVNEQAEVFLFSIHLPSQNSGNQFLVAGVGKGSLVLG